MSDRPPYYPIFLDLAGRDAVLIGGGNVSARKAETLMKCGARVTIVAPQCTGEIAKWAGEGVLVWKQKTYEASDVDGAAIVIASTNDPAVNEEIAADCRARRIPVNVIDAAPLCDFIVPAVVDRGSVQIAVSTGGRSPAFARVVKQEIQSAIGSEHGELNDILGSLRDAAKASPKLPADADRKRFFDALLARGILGMLREGRRREAYEAVAEICAAEDVALSDLVRAGLAEPPS
ncbi:MAG TPA: bifunctional precorrin-2 dehydrogenase/sirohydrochlorin ferrochelatase [Thermoanaerobaculia bacterium]|nr:bifunctional precorrin-2 dehydrogenase/sirohydrochlorin ferrochelatase [Thermoanaerobaculia bacterium]